MVDLDTVVKLDERIDALREVLRKIHMRATPHEDDTLEDCKRQLRHIASYAATALEVIDG
jgi:hypothetical protein